MVLVPLVIRILNDDQHYIYKVQIKPFLKIKLYLTMLSEFEILPILYQSRADAESLTKNKCVTANVNTAESVGNSVI